MLHVALVRSPVAHGTVNSIDLGDAASMPGVVAVYSGDDLGMPSFQGFPMMPDTFNRPIFATEKVRFVGDIIAAVVAETLQQATDAAQEIYADIDPLPVIIDPADGLAPDAPLLFPEAGSNVCFASQFPPARRGRHPRRRARPLRGCRCRSVRSRWSASAWPVCRWRTTASSASPTATR